MRACVCTGVFERKAVIATEYKAARFLQRNVLFFLFSLSFLCFLLLSPFSNTIEPKGHFIDHSEVMSPIVCLVINLNVILFFFHSEHLVQYK